MPDAKSYFLHVLTPLHVGAGFGAGYVDLPIMREKTTNWPLVPGSSFKGVLADHWGANEAARTTNKELALAFGSGGDDTANAGALVFTDARILCFPVQSLYGTWAWFTSPLALRRFQRDTGANLKIPQPTDGLAYVPKLVESNIVSAPKEPATIYASDLDFSAKEDADCNEWANHLAQALFPKPNDPWLTLFKNRFAIIHDDTLSYFTQTATEVVARIHIDPATKTVATGQLWYEESLPAETILTGLVWSDGIYNNRRNADVELALKKFCTEEETLQIGGKSTVGRGRTRCIFGAA